MANITIKCSHAGYVYNPTKIPIWRRNQTVLSIGSQLAVANNRYNLFIGEIGLDGFNIVNVTYADDGTYTCYQSGKRIISYKLTVYSK